jgi:hypothetical protein
VTAIASRFFILAMMESPFLSAPKSDEINQPAHGGSAKHALGRARRTM